MKAIVDPDLCTGCEDCVEGCPAVFVMNDEGLAEVKVPVVPADAEEACRTAADDCPAAAIELED